MATILQQINSNLLDPRQYSSKDVKVIGEYPVTSKFEPNTDTVEFFIYDLNKNLISYTPEFTQYKVIDPSINQNGLSTINIDVEKSVSQRGLNIGTYSVVFNFFKNQLNSSFRNNFFIKEVSSNRTELRLGSNLLSNEELEEQVSNFITSNSQEDYFPDFVVNFGENNQYIANNILLDKTDPNNFSVLIKLYAPLPLQFEKNDTLWIATEVADPRAFKITFEEEPITTNNAIPLRGPDYNINIKDQISNATTFKSKNDLLTNTQLTSSYDQLQNILNQKGINLNINYTTFSNFVHFSSAEQRLENFYYKVGLIESASSQLSQSLNITSSYTASSQYSSSKANLEFTIANTISNFDGYENHLYYTTGSNNLTWPKITTTPIPRLRSTGSSEVLAWYGSVANQTGLLFSASLYDEENQDNLIYTIPEYLREDPSNAPYQLFIEMMGQYFDELYLYADDITNKHNADNRLDFGISKDLVGDVLKSFGIKLYENNFSSDDLYASLIGINASGSLNAPTGNEVIETYISASTDVIPLDDVNKETYKRIYHNMPYLLKKKGTVEGLRTLINIFGIPTTVLRVNEFGGKNSIEDSGASFDYYQNKFNYGVQDVDVVTKFKSIANFGGETPSTVFFRFKYISGNLPANNTSFNLASSSGAVTAIQYKGGAGVSASFNGSILSASEFNGEITLGTAKVSGSFFNGDWWNLALTDSESVKLVVTTQNNTEGDGLFGGVFGYSTSSVGNATFTGDEFRLLGTNLKFAYQELKFYNKQLSGNANGNLAMNPYMVRSATETGTSEASKNELLFRAPLGSELEINRSSLATNYTSYHPAITGSSITNSFSGSGGAGDSNYQFSASSGTVVKYNPYTQSVYYTQPYVGLKNRVTEKIKPVSYTVPNNTLSPFKSVIQDSQYGGGYDNVYSRDINKTEVVFSPTNEIDDNIISSLRQFNIGDYIGDPNYLIEPSASYSALDTVRDNYFLKYYSAYEWRDYVRLIKYFNNSLFNMIKDFTPAKSSLTTGVVIKQHILERNKYPTPQVTQSAISHDNGSSIRPNDQLTGLISLPSISGSENIANGGTGGVFDPNAKLFTPTIGLAVESDNIVFPNNTEANVFPSEPTVENDPDNLFTFITGSTNKLVINKTLNTKIEVHPQWVTSASGDFAIRINSDVRGDISITTSSYESAVSSKTHFTNQLDLFAGEAISIFGKVINDGATEETNQIIIDIGSTGIPIPNNAANGTDALPASQQSYRKTFNTLTGSFTVYENTQEEFFNGELPIVKTQLSNVLVTNTETVDGIQATNQVISSSMIGPIPTVTSNVALTRGGASSGQTGLFLYQQIGLPGTATYEPYDLAESNILNLAANFPSRIQKSSFMIKELGLGITKIYLGFTTGSDDLWTASFDQLGYGDNFDFTFTQMSSSFPQQPTGVPYRFTIASIEKTDPVLYYTVYVQNEVGKASPYNVGGGASSYLFSANYTNAPLSSNISFKEEVDFKFTIPQYSLNDDGVLETIPNKNATILLNEANPLANSVNTNRVSYTYQTVDFGAGTITASNLPLIKEGYATRAQVQDSNYTKTGHINARYNGSRASSPDFNIRSKI